MEWTCDFLNSGLLFWVPVIWRERPWKYCIIVSIASILIRTLIRKNILNKLEAYLIWLWCVRDTSSVILWNRPLSVFQLCSPPLGAGSVLSPPQQTTPLPPPSAIHISGRSHYSLQEVAPKLPPSPRSRHPTSPSISYWSGHRDI